MRLPWMVMTLVVMLAGCQKSGTSTPDAGPVVELPPALGFAEDQPNMLFTYVDQAGTVRSVDKSTDVPPERRKNVMVLDLSRSPEQRQSDRYVYFSDLTVKAPDGKYRANPMSRYQAPKLAQPLPDDAPAQDGSGVVVYSASWCGFCKKTMAFLKQKGVPYREKDVEKEPGADAELQAKARKAGVRVSGVPVTDFMGELVVGFDQPKLEGLIAQHAVK